MAITQILKETVSDDDTILEPSQAQKKYGVGTEGFVREISAAIIIRNISSIPNILKKANELSGTENEFSLYPISSGKNWGYGSTLPASDKKTTVIIDLSCLDKVTYFNPQTGIVTVQPGVTQASLRDFLDKNGAENFMVPVTGAGPTCSVLGNALERGYGITPYTDHFEAVNSLKAFLPDGQFYQSALCELDKSNDKLADKIFKWGLGPYLDGLFTQSSFGIVTEVTLSLKEMLEGFDSFYFRFKKDEDFERAIELISDILKMHEGIVGSINLMDRRRVISMMADNPERDAHKVLSQKTLENLARKYDVPAWTVIGSLYGTKRVISAAKQDIKAQIRKAKLKCQIIFSSALRIKCGRWITNKVPNRLLQKERRMIQALDMGIDIMRGIPNQVALPLCYWRTPQLKKNESLNPAEDRCGLLWYAPLLPMDKGKMRNFVEMVRQICPKHNIEPLITLTNFNHRCSDSTIPILFDQSNPNALTDAQKCLDELFRQGLKLGFVPYRLNIDQQQHLDKTNLLWNITNEINRVFDPNGVVSSGRYGS